MEEDLIFPLQLKEDLNLFQIEEEQISYFLFPISISLFPLPYFHFPISILLFPFSYFHFQDLSSS